MDFEFTEEQKMFQKAIRDFAEKEMAPLVDEAEANEAFPIGLFHRMGELGYIGMGMPEKYGGGGIGLTGECIFKEEMSRICAGITQSVVFLPPSFLDYATEVQRQKNLLPAIKGEKLLAFGLTEPNAGSDAASVQTTATKDGDGYVISGQKIFISNGSIADFVIALVVTDKEKGYRGLSAIIIEKDTPGFSSRQLKKFGMHSANTGELTFNNCRVPRENLLGEEGQGSSLALHCLDCSRMGIAAQSVGLSQRALDESLDYAHQREAFGKKIADFQAIQFMIADISMLIEAGRLLAYRAANLFDQGKPITKESAMAKLFASEAANKIAYLALQIHGGYGYSKEYSVERIYRDARVLTIYEGTSEIQRLVISRELLSE